MSKISTLEKLSIIIYDHNFDKIHYALVIASAAAAIGKPTTLFFTMGATRALLENYDDNPEPWSKMPLSNSHGTGEEQNEVFREMGIATFDELIEACIQFEVKFLVCEMGVKANKFEHKAFRKDLKIQHGGLVTFLNDVSKDGAILFI